MCPTPTITIVAFIFGACYVYARGTDEYLFLFKAPRLMSCRRLCYLTQVPKLRNLESETRLSHGLGIQKIYITKIRMA